ncbi:MAG: hypothetical protein LBD77_11925 [Bifidobacteriaceae bacterium]|nr:hypothetical protein [Bifidobacteriaceae bacterium]
MFTLSLTPPVRLAGHWHHTAAIGRLVASLYAAGGGAGGGSGGWRRRHRRTA